MASIFQNGILGFGDRDSDRMIYVLGIIDLLQEWNLGKKGEHFFKTVIKGHHSSSVSAVAPDEYATRFRKALTTLLRW